MNDRAVIHRLHEHLRWSRARFLAVAQTLSREALDRSFEIGMGSVWATIVHLYAAELAWINAIDGNPSGRLVTAGDVPDWPTLHDRWAASDERWDRVLKGLADSKLDQPVRKARAMPGCAPDREYETSLGDVLMHICTHAAYTMAQANNMLRHVGVDPPNLMLITMARDETNE